MSAPDETIPTLDRLVALAQDTSNGYHEFLRVPSMSCGVYVLPAGAKDRQSPHREDEVYYVVRGRGRFVQGSLDRPVGPGDTLFVPAQVEHRFHTIEDELVVLVVFSPAETG